MRVEHLVSLLRKSNKKATTVFIQSVEINKYPRTAHLQGSRLQKGDDPRKQVPLSALTGLYAVLEEKLDGANAGNSFTGAGDLLLQSRGHYLVGGGSERQFNLLKPWATAHESDWLDRFEDRYVVYGEWMYAKHTVFYDRLPHYFNEFDIFDRQTSLFLSTRRRREMLMGSSILSVPVLYEGEMPTKPKLLQKLIRRSLAKSEQWRDSFEQVVAREGLPLDLCWTQTNPDDEAEGLYLKIEDEDHVLARYKFVRQGFVQTILDSGSHHSHRPILPNQLAPGVDLYAPQLTVTWEDLGLKTIRGLDELAAWREPE